MDCTCGHSKQDHYDCSVLPECKKSHCPCEHFVAVEMIDKIDIYEVSETRDGFVVIAGVIK